MDMMAIRRRVMLGSRKKESDILFHVENCGLVKSNIDTGVEIIAQDMDFTVCLDITLGNVTSITILRHPVVQDDFLIAHYNNFTYSRVNNKQDNIYDNEVTDGGRLYNKRYKIVFKHEKASGIYKLGVCYESTDKYSQRTNTVLTPNSGSVYFLGGSCYELHDATIYNRFLSEKEVKDYFGV